MVHHIVMDDTRLTYVQKTTYAALARFAYRDQATVSQATLARTASLAAYTVHRALAALRDAGYISWQPRHGTDDAGCIAHRYTLKPLTAHYDRRQHTPSRHPRIDEGRGSQDEGRGSQDEGGGLTGLEGWAHRMRGVGSQDDSYKEQDKARLLQEDNKSALDVDLPRSIVRLYDHLTEQQPTVAMAAILAGHLAAVGEMTLSAMLMEAAHWGAVTPGSLETARRKLTRRRRGNIIRLQPDSAPPPLPETGHPVWRQLLDELRSVMTRDNYMTWLYPTRVIDADGDTLTVAVTSDSHAHWLRARLSGRVGEALARLGHEDLTIRYVVVAQEATDDGPA